MTVSPTPSPTVRPTAISTIRGLGFSLGIPDVKGFGFFVWGVLNVGNAADDRVIEGSTGSKEETALKEE
jgi:hypothetical protein